MSEEERKRFFRYSLRRYQALGPAAVRLQIFKLRDRFVSEDFMSEENFWELYKDLVETNGWNDSHVLAYFETYTFEKVA
tara:strand:- start:671 stop:907 length:237 start_codon:yes stop_codon:yes gene_type:complete